MNPQVIAETHPERTATIMAESGKTMSYRELDRLARSLATSFRTLGLRYGDHIAFMIDNEIMYHPVAWGAWYAGLYFTPISTRLTEHEVRYLIEDSESKLVVASPACESILQSLRPQMTHVAHWFVTAPGAGALPDIRSLANASTPLPVGPRDRIGVDMLYSSGTTGRPKGIRPKFGAERDEPNPLANLLTRLYGFDGDTRYLTPAPLYHGSPTKFSMTIHRVGGTNVIMERFDAEAALAAIERHRVTHSQWVPTMLHRMSRLPEPVRNRFNLTSHRVAIHAAAPCPTELKRQMIEWWGPIVHEFYAGSEAVGFTVIDSAESVAKPGSVGRSVLGEIHIVGDDGEDVPTGEIGHVHFAGGPRMEYHNDPEKTARAYNAHGWATFGDMGHVDQDGYLFLADRKDFMIITGGVNVYPREVEDVLVMHPAVEDVAVFGVPNDEFGEEVKAVVQPRGWPTNEDAYCADLLAYCRQRLSPIKVPRSIDLIAELPRQPNGKLYKRKLRESYLT